MSRNRFIALLLALITLVVYLPVSNFPFINFDDREYVSENPMVMHGLTWTGLRQAFTTFHASNWHPLTWISHMVDCQIFGLNAGGHHFVNVLLHAANAVLVFLLWQRLSQKIWPAAFAAALFAWHPLHVESVAWISERKDVLSTLFALLTLLCYGRATARNASSATREESQSDSRLTLYSSRFYALALVCFALGLLAKPMLVTLPFVMLLLDFWPLGRISIANLHLPTLLRCVSEKIPFFLLTVASSVATLFAQHEAMAKIPLLNRLENVPVALMGYLSHIFWPSGLCALYPLKSFQPAGTIIFCALAILAVCVVVWQLRRTKPYLLMGWLWFLGTLFPVIGVVQVGSQAMADRYTYLPSIGFFFALAVLADELAKKIPVPKMVPGIAATAICLACIFTTEHQLQFWRSSEALFRRSLDVTAHGVSAMVNLAETLTEQGKYDEAVKWNRAAAKLDDEQYQVHNNLGVLFGRMNRHDDAVAEYREAVRRAPGVAAVHSGLATELAALGKDAEALREYSTAVQLNTNFSAAYLEMAKIYLKLGRNAEAAQKLGIIPRGDWDNVTVLSETARIFASCDDDQVRNPPVAVHLALAANEMSGHNDARIFDILGMALAANGDFTNAITAAQNALELARAARLGATEPIAERIELYRQQQPWRESFRATNAP